MPPTTTTSNYTPNTKYYGTSTNPVTGVNANTGTYNAPDAKDPYGSYTPGVTPTTTTPPVTTTTTPTTSTDQTTQNANGTIASATPQLNTINSQIDQAAAEFHNTTDGIINGTVPLSSGEQAQVQALQQSFNSLIDQQKLQNVGASGLANIRGYQTGAAEYDPTFQAKTIGSIVTAGLNKVANLNIQMAGAVATLTDQLRTNDFNKVKAAYDTYNAALKDRRDTIQSTIDKAQAAIKDARDYALQALIHSDTVSYQDKELALQNSQLSETKRKNLADEALALENFKLDKQYKAAVIAKTYHDMSDADITGAQNWVTAIKSGQAKLTDVPKNLKNAVIAGLANGGSSTSTILGITQNSIKELNDMVNGGRSYKDVTAPTTGFSSAVGAKGLTGGLLFGYVVPGSKAAAFDAKLKQTVNDVVLPNLTILHGLGRVTDREFQALQSSITSLNTNLPEEDFKKELQNVTNTVNQMVIANQSSPDTVVDQLISGTGTSGLDDLYNLNGGK